MAKSHGVWVAAVESAAIEHRAIPEKTRDQHRGRARGCAISWNRSHAIPARAHMRHQLLELWHLVSTLLVRYRHLRRRGILTQAQALSMKIEELMQ
eukprot:7225763-Pyramimonas_sp.AAC.1